MGGFGQDHGDFRRCHRAHCRCQLARRHVFTLALRDSRRGFLLEGQHCTARRLLTMEVRARRRDKLHRSRDTPALALRVEVICRLLQHERLERIRWFPCTVAIRMVHERGRRHRLLLPTSLRMTLVHAQI